MLFGVSFHSVQSTRQLSGDSRAKAKVVFQADLLVLPMVSGTTGTSKRSVICLK